MLGSEFIIVAILLRFWAGASYLIATWRGRIHPNPVTWFFWGLAPLVAFTAQIQETIDASDWISLALGIGPLLIFAVSIGRGSRWRIGFFDLLCGMSALVGIVLWRITADPFMALTFGIVADILGGIPTIRKSYVAPHSERAFPYFLSMMSMIVTLLTISNWTPMVFAFPLYILIINTVLFTLIATKVGKWGSIGKRSAMKMRPRRLRSSA